MSDDDGMIASGPDQPERWRAWVRRWDAQQAVYVEARERRFEVMFSLLDHLVGEDVRVLDLAAGPGAVSARLLARRADARSVAVDVDPVLLQLGQRAYGDLGGRLRWVKADLREGDWLHRLGQSRFDAVISSTATHWLSAPALAQLYQHVAGLLEPGSPLINGDFFPVASHVPRIAKVLRDEDQRRRQVAAHAGRETWERWWAELRAEPVLAQAFDERDRIFPPDWRSGQQPPDLEFYRAALRAAGFTEVAVVWQDLEERVLLALR